MHLPTVNRGVGTKRPKPPLPGHGTSKTKTCQGRAGVQPPLPPGGEQEGFSGSNFTIGGDQGGSLLGYSELVKWHGFRPFELITLGHLRSRPYLAAGTRHPALLSAPFSQLKPHAAGAKSNDRAHLPNVKASSGLHWNRTKPARQVAAGRFANLYRVDHPSARAIFFADPLRRLNPPATPGHGLRLPSSTPLSRSSGQKMSCADLGLGRTLSGWLQVEDVCLAGGTIEKFIAVGLLPCIHSFGAMPNRPKSSVALLPAVTSTKGTPYFASSRIVWGASCTTKFPAQSVLGSQRGLMADGDTALS
ncbi:hypothetical protein CSUB01_06801 [Colletotrichum sublineola]|uniref:Uncharacterized protein n=1 Tax=Colletotrichum sublineola TaxID=1173701 RepID=A0A066X351_COLSU|nr:hypothetical protein CSUB01_06801 [Colletotrichum sublineola]